MICTGLRRCRCQISSFRNPIRGQLSPHESRSSLFCVDGLRSDGNKAYACACDRAVFDVNAYCYGHSGEVTDAAFQLEVATHWNTLRSGYHGFDAHLVMRQRVLEGAVYEIRDRDLPPAVGSLGNKTSVKGDHDRSPIALGVCVAQRTDDGASIANNRIGDERSGFRHGGLFACQLVGAL